MTDPETEKPHHRRLVACLDGSPDLEKSWYRGIFTSEGPVSSAPSGEVALSLWSSGRFVASVAVGARCRSTREPLGIAARRLDVVAIRRQVTGRVRARIDDEEVIVEAGDLLVLDLMRPFELEPMEPGIERTLWLGRGRLAPDLGGDPGLHGMRVVADDPIARVVGACLDGLIDAAGEASTVTMERLVDGVAALLPPVLRPLCAARGGGARPPFASAASIATFIERHLGSPTLEVDLICGSFGLSRSSLYRTFEPLGGVSAFIRRRRLERVHRDLTAPTLADRPIAEIAHRWGFQDIGAFGRAFTRAYGVGPRVVRRVALQGANRPGHEAGADEGLLYSWLRALSAQ